jgi:hypothetical protein
MKRPGEIELTFFNDQLAAVWWFPIEADASDTTLICPPCGTPRRGIDFRGRHYLAWEDPELIRGMNRWLQDNS